MIVQQQANHRPGGVAGIELLQEGNEVAAFVGLADDFDHLAGVQVQPRQQRHRAESLVFVVPRVARVLPGHRRAVWTRRCQSLQARLFIVRKGNRGRLAQLSSQPPLVDELHFLVDVQHGGHLGFKVGITALRIIADFVRTKFRLRQNRVQLGATQPAQFGVTGGFAALANMLGQQPIGPQLRGVTQFLRLLAGTVHHPGRRVVTEAARSAGSGQLSQRRLPAEAQTLVDTQHHGVAVHPVGARDGLITHGSGSRIQQNPGPHRAPFLLASSLADSLQLLQFLLGENQGLALLWECHAPTKAQKVANV